MNAEIKALWVADLRANPDKQGFARLDDGAKQCCLGRLCKLAVLAGIIPPPTEIGSEGLEYGPDGDSDTPLPEPPQKSFTVLPLAVCKWAGLETANPTPPGASSSLAALNDEEIPFSVIADIIEKSL